MADYLDSLTGAQRDAAEATTGPVCILAGAGTGKTTTITHRIAHQVRSKVFPATAIMALTFTDKAAKEMGERLHKLGVSQVRARTFHAAALGLYKSSLNGSGDLLNSKPRILLPIISSLPKEHRKVAIRDFAGEIEWAKNRRLKPKSYLMEIGTHRPPIPAELMQGMFQKYETAKRRNGQIDFEDLLDFTARMMQANRAALDTFRGQFRAFTVDEYQDVNLLQQSLLDIWVGDRQDICVVGDDYQSIYGFTGATPKYLLDFPRRYRAAKVVKLTSNYRSTPEILATANRLAPTLGGISKTLHTTRPSGSAPEVRSFVTGESEIDWLIEQVRIELDRGCVAEQIAILFRVNARSEELEEALSGQGIPYQVKDQAFLNRPAARAVLARIGRQPQEPIGGAVAAALRALGYVPDARAELEGEEATRQADLSRLEQLAAEFGKDREVESFVSDLKTRFTAEEDGRGVQLLTYHRAKGKEYEVVFLPRLEDGEMPFALAQGPDEIAEERRLFYVGITRARSRLLISWAQSRYVKRRRFSKEPSRFLEEIRPPRPSAPPTSATGRPRVKWPKPATPQRSAVRPSELYPTRLSGRSSSIRPADALRAQLEAWRRKHRERLGGESSLMFDAMTLARIADARPRTRDDLLSIRGVTAAKVDRFGDEVLKLVNR